MSASCGHNVSFDGTSAGYRRALWAVIALNAAMFAVEIIAGALRVPGPVEADPDRMEIGMGSAEGLTQAEMAARWPMVAAGGMALEAPDGERLAAVWARVGDALARVVAREERPCVVVTHGVAGRLLLGRYLGLGLAEAARLEVTQDAIFRLEGGRAERRAVRPV